RRPEGGQSDWIVYDAELARAALWRPLPFFRAGSGSITMRCPSSSVWLSKLVATATSDNPAISTNPNPRQRPDALSLTASALITPPAREKCACRALLVTETARLPTYNLGIQCLLSVSGGSNCPSDRPQAGFERTRPKAGTSHSICPS